MKNILFIIMMLLGNMVWSQKQPLSMNDAITLAIKNRYDLKIQKANTSVTEKQSSQIKTRRLPQITSDLDLRYNIKLQTNVIPGSFTGAPNTPDRLVRFGTRYNTLWGFNLNQSIYNPNNVSDRRISNLQTEYQKQNEKLTEINIKQVVTEAYFSVLLWKEKVKLSEENVVRAQEVFQVSSDLSNKGQATNYDVQRNKVDLENAKATDEQSKRNYRLSFDDLLYEISSDSITEPILTENITDLMNNQNFIPTDKQEMKRTELEQEKIQLEVYNQNIKKQNLAWFPTVSVYANYSLQYLNNGYDSLAVNDWFPFSYLGAKASFSLYDGGLKSKTKQEFELRAQASQFQYEKLKNDFKQEILSAQTSLDNSLSDLNYQKKNLELIENLYKIDNDRFKKGTIRQSDLTTTFYTLQQTQTNYLNSVYNYLIAVVNYKKALGIL